MPKLALGIATAAILTTLIFLHLDYYQIDSRLEQFRVGQPAPRAILSRDELLWEDESETLRRREAAAELVPMQYAADHSAIVKAQADLHALFGLLHAPTLTERDRVALNRFGLSAGVVSFARQSDPRTLNRLQTVAGAILAELMATRIEEDNVKQQAAPRIALLTARQSLTPTQAALVQSAVRATLRPNWVRDDTRTADLQRQAREAISPAVRVFRPGEVVLPQGTLITETLIRQLKEKHLLAPALARLVPVATLMLFAVFALGVYLRSYYRSIYTNHRKLVLLAFLLIAPTWAVTMLSGGNGTLQFLIGLIMVPAGSMAIAGLLGVPVAIVSTVVLTVAAGLAANQPFAMVVLTLGSALAGLVAVSVIWPASRAVSAVLGLIGINLLLLMSLDGIQPGSGLPSLAQPLPLSPSMWPALWQSHPFWEALGSLVLWAAAGGLGATFIAVGTIYMLARPFGITTHYRLMELSNPNEPLLRRMMTDAPGTYHSSVMVANMAEAAADAIGANALLARVAALYHDIGKLKRPAFFVENQAPLGIENVHQRLSPRLSYLILTSHVRDGVDMATTQRLPEEVTSIIREHHGTTLAAYFYHRALNESSGRTVAEHEFRYPGPKPSTREAAVVMLSDSVQASVKSLKDPTPPRIDSMVQDILNNRLADGQLEDCDLTLRDLHRISEVFVRILTGLYTYTRLEYPDMKREGARLRANLNSESTTPSSESKMLTPGG